jgi:hypothetical protein
MHTGGWFFISGVDVVSICSLLLAAQRCQIAWGLAFGVLLVVPVLQHGHCAAATLLWPTVATCHVTFQTHFTAVLQHTVKLVVILMS